MVTNDIKCRLSEESDRFAIFNSITYLSNPLPLNITQHHHPPTLPPPKKIPTPRYIYYAYLSIKFIQTPYIHNVIHVFKSLWHCGYLFDLKELSTQCQHISHQIYRTISDTIFLAINNYNLVDNKIKYFSFEILNIFLHLILC